MLGSAFLLLSPRLGGGLVVMKILAFLVCSSLFLVWFGSGSSHFLFWGRRVFWCSLHFYEVLATAFVPEKRTKTPQELQWLKTRFWRVLVDSDGFSFGNGSWESSSGGSNSGCGSVLLLPCGRKEPSRLETLHVIVTLKIAKHSEHLDRPKKAAIP